MADPLEELRRDTDSLPDGADKDEARAALMDLEKVYAENRRFEQYEAERKVEERKERLQLVGALVFAAALVFVLLWFRERDGRMAALGILGAVGLGSLFFMRKTEPSAVERLLKERGVKVPHIDGAEGEAALYRAYGNRNEAQAILREAAKARLPASPLVQGAERAWRVFMSIVLVLGLLLFIAGAAFFVILPRPSWEGVLVCVLLAAYCAWKIRLAWK